MPTIIWDEGTAYDFFASLYVLHRPNTFAVRPAWAAGVRSRLNAPQRDWLEKIHSFLPVPLSWLYLLPAEAKNAAGALNHLAQLNAAERLPSLLFNAETSIEARTILQQIALRQTWSSAEQEVLRTALIKRGISPRPAALNHMCEVWCDLKTAGEQYLNALNMYYQVFFKEEDPRVQSLLNQVKAQALALAQTMPVPQLLEQLSNGVHFEQAEKAEEIILVPSYWSSPLLFYMRLPVCQPPMTPGLSERTNLLVMFGARPEHHDLIPGERLPSHLVDTMKAIADPTRLRILHYLAEADQTPSQLARRLRLRPPTVVHHLNALRLAGLVEVTLYPEGERAYKLRQQILDGALTDLVHFLSPNSNK